MTTIDRLHDRAMSLADRADAARASGDGATAVALYRRALAAERKAADLVADRPRLEPTRSVLHRSAASLALAAKDYDAAEFLICRGLMGRPPKEIADELRDVWEQVTFERHLRIRGVTLTETELLVSMWGEGVGYGYASCDEVIDRLDRSRRLLYRTAERKSGRAYREHGDVPKEIQERFHVWASAAKAASYAFVLRVGSSDAQLALPFHISAGGIVNELMDCLELINQGDMQSLQTRIPDDAYRRNFLGLARELAPDGKSISSVGFASVTEGRRREVPLTIPREQVSGALRGTFGLRQEESSRVTVVGRLMAADSRKARQGHIEVIDSDGGQHTFEVPKGLMADLVRPHYEREVVAEGVQDGRRVVLESLRAADQGSV